MPSPINKFCLALILGGFICNPAFAQLSTATFTNDETNLYVSFHVSEPFNYYHVFIDTDQMLNTGYKIAGIGADILVENNTIYRSIGPGWNWNKIQDISFTNTGTMASWVIPLQYLGLSSIACDTPIDLVLEATPGSDYDITNKLTYRLSIGQQCLTNPDASFTSDNFIFHYNIANPQTYYRIYIDMDNDPSTGFPVGGLGAEYLLEGDSLYSYTGPGWNWQFIKKINFTYEQGVAHWEVKRTDLSGNCASTLTYLAQGATTDAVSKGPKSLTFTSSSNCKYQRIAVPAFFKPDCDTNPMCYWDQVTNYIPPVQLVVINPAQGPGADPMPEYLGQVKKTQDKGSPVVGYVTTNLATEALEKVEAQIDQYYSWYKVDGIFFDKANPDCASVNYYQTLNNYVKSKGGKGVTVNDFGKNMPECLINSADIVVTFEGEYTQYLSYQSDAWVNKYSKDKFWHIVYNTPEDKVLNTILLSEQRSAGWIYVSPNFYPNQYVSMPPTSYWILETGGIHLKFTPIKQAVKAKHKKH